MRIVDVREVTAPIASPIRNAYIDFSRMTASLAFSTAEELLPRAVTYLLRKGGEMCGRRSHQVTDSVTSGFQHDSVAGQLLRGGRGGAVS